MRTYNINIEALDNGFILGCYNYVQPAKQLRKYLTTMEEVADEITAFLDVDIPSTPF